MIRDILYDRYYVLRYVWSAKPTNKIQKRGIMMAMKARNVLFDKKGLEEFMKFMRRFFDNEHALRPRCKAVNIRMGIDCDDLDNFAVYHFYTDSLAADFMRMEFTEIHYRLTLGREEPVITPFFFNVDHTEEGGEL